MLVKIEVYPPHTGGDHKKIKYLDERDCRVLVKFLILRRMKTYRQDFSKEDKVTLSIKFSSTKFQALRQGNQPLKFHNLQVTMLPQCKNVTILGYEIRIPKFGMTVFNINSNV